MRKTDTKRTMPRGAEVTLQSIVELEAALQSGGLTRLQQNQKSKEES